ncbi:hypothetical protein JYT74_03490 [Crocinitomix catalasitica]|nr:hypothetical protein [Crocinitomix catalasitica]
MPFILEFLLENHRVVQINKKRGFTAIIVIGQVMSWNKLSVFKLQIGAFPIFNRLIK